MVDNFYFSSNELIDCEYDDLIEESKSILMILNVIKKKDLLEKLKNMYSIPNSNLNINSTIKTEIILQELINHVSKKNNSHNQRNTYNFKQSIYIYEIKDIIQFLLNNIDNFKNFILILQYVSIRRKLIEILKLNPDYMKFGTFRKEIGNERLFSFLTRTKANHLINELKNQKNRTTDIRERKELNNHAFTYNRIKLTSRNSVVGFADVPYLRIYSKWIHTKSEYIFPLLLKLNKLYDRFITSNVKSKRLLSKLYWLYMQTCPFERGSASIGEIIFSALLQKYFGCNFKIYYEAVKPEIIPDIHALSYDLKKFQDIFWERFTTCPINKRNNNNQNQNVPNNFFYN